MSRRREAAELARALQLSQQEANHLAQLPPHTLSSRSTGTQDSKELELRPMGTVNPVDVMGPPTGSVSVPTSSSSHSHSSTMAIPRYSGLTSVIQSFTPSHLFKDTLGSIRSPIDTSAPRSSPVLGNAIPSSRLGSTSKFRPISTISNATSVEPTSSPSSHGPLLSPTQVSRPRSDFAGIAQTPASIGNTRPLSPFRHQLSSSPVSSPPRARFREIDDVPPRRAITPEPLEPQEDRRPTAPSSTRKSALQVIVPTSRSKSISIQRHSSDPIDFLSADVDVTSFAPVKKRSEAGPSIMDESQYDNAGTRVSRRVADLNAKKAAEKEERARKRRAERALKEEKARAAAQGRVEDGEESVQYVGAKAMKDSEASSSTKGNKRMVRESRSERVLKKARGEERSTVTEGAISSRERTLRNNTSPVIDTRARPKLDVDDETLRGPSDRPEKEGESSAEATKEAGEDNGITSNNEEVSSKEESRSTVVQAPGPSKTDTIGETEDSTAASRAKRSPDDTSLQKSVRGTKGKAKEVADIVVQASNIDKDEDSEVKQQSTHNEIAPTPARPPLNALPRKLNSPALITTPSHRPSPGPDGSGVKFRTPRNDLSAVLSKFPSAKAGGMSRRIRIAPLHSKIGPPAKAPPPIPKKPERKKKGEGGDENGVKKIKKGDVEWLMQDDGGW
ncbi:hypothetical protein TREMEDRAFT_61733 [Tremella mesenterica DSM 1558]|uniref:uncharacterized protein n=1 Tax=Tremella mesenterica (strain ATCC 24925 / CBS 8224 / DSM 1558 / NBRC 9311 / NRRL Y-6157 / RJB 2259-6 / UBC 559-6) TaxID=578456 RepID=UPI0003F4A02B|nr:uncharacterized protein TREMEDRAFT_61733 [Tremella mesenterica DSM 1558]EIW69966.1 hypothetical protein TREMEDRAFT_61733 [Tremella mesenterica DSM 1558]